MHALVVLPGLDGTATLHAEFVRAVAPAFREVKVISYPPDLSLDYAQLEAWVRPQLPEDVPFILLGESFSGPVAISIAAAPPANLAGLVLSTTFDSAPLPLSGVLATMIGVAPMCAATPALLSWWLFGRWSSRPLLASLREALRAVAPVVLRHRAKTALGANVRAKLASILVPVLVLRATGDRLIAKRRTELLAARVERCTLVHIEGPHLLLQAVPEACAGALRSYASALQ